MFQIRIIIVPEVENPSKITEIIFRAITHNNFPEMIKKTSTSKYQGYVFFFFKVMF